MKLSSVRNVLVIFAIAAIAIAGFGLLGLAAFFGIQAVIFVDGAASLAMIVVCAAIFWFLKIDWRAPEYAAVLISVMSFVGMFFDARGNPIYNWPFVWLFGSSGSRMQVREIVSQGGGGTGVNYEFQLIDIHGAVERIVSGWIVVPFRFVEYLIVLSIVVSIVSVIRRPSGSNWLP